MANKKIIEIKRLDLFTHSDGDICTHIYYIVECVP